MTNTQYEMEILELKNLLKISNNRADLAEKRLSDIQDIYNALDDNYQDTIGDVNYSHEEIDNTETGWLYKINMLSDLRQ
jgi:hypothetical protein